MQKKPILPQSLVIIWMLALDNDGGGHQPLANTSTRAGAIAPSITPPKDSPGYGGICWCVGGGPHSWRAPLS